MQDIAVKVIQVTAEGLEELQRELKELTEVKLPAVIERVAKAREYGDLLENAEYHSAREDQALIETRIDEIEDMLTRAKIVHKTNSLTKVGMGSTVILAIVGKKGKTLTFQIVGEFQSDPGDNKVSSVSPIGKALMGKKKGDHIKVDAPAGSIEYVIQDIK